MAKMITLKKYVFSHGAFVWETYQPTLKFAKYRMTLNLRKLHTQSGCQSYPSVKDFDVVKTDEKILIKESDWLNPEFA